MNIHSRSSKQDSTRARETHLGTPITQVVHRLDIPTARLVEVSKERADNSAPKMADMERLGYVRRRVLDDDRFTLARVVGAVTRVFRGRIGVEPLTRLVGGDVYLVNDFANKRGGVELEMKEGLVMNDRSDELVGLELSFRKRRHRVHSR